MVVLGLRGGRRHRVTALVLVAFAASAWVAPTAGALPRPTRPNLEQVRQRVDQLHDQAEAATEKYNGTKDKIAGLKLQVSAAQLKVTDQQKAVQRARAELGKVAVEAYKAGDLATLSLFFDDDPDKFLGTDGMVVSIGSRRAAAVETVRRQRQQLVASMTGVQEQQQRLQQAMKELQTTRSQVLVKLADATTTLNQLTQEERERLGQMRSGRERTSLEDLGITVPPSGRLGCTDVPVVVPPGRAGKVISYACAQIGDPYQWGADGPSRYDCSGLTMMAWRQAGVALPHNAAAQASEGTPVKRSQLQAGDLVFYHSPISHVAIYIGGGLMLHAPQTGDVVKIVPLRPDIVAAVHL